MSSFPLHYRAVAMLPLRMRRKLLRVMWHAQSLGAAKSGSEMAQTIGASLRLSGRDARRIDREFEYYDELAALEWVSVLMRTKSQVLSDTSHIAIDGEDLIGRVAASGRPVILATLHMANYVIGLATIMNRHFRGRQMLILRAREDRPYETRVMQRVSEIGINMRFLNVANKADYLSAVRFAKNGAVVIYFVDLPASYGAPLDVTLFGKQRQIAFGIDKLAKLAEATVVPLKMKASVSGDIVTVGKPFEVATQSALERDRVAALICKHIEISVRDNPAQWHMWPRLDEFASIVHDYQDAAE